MNVLMSKMLENLGEDPIMFVSELNDSIEHVADSYTEVLSSMRRVELLQNMRMTLNICKNNDVFIKNHLDAFESLGCDPTVESIQESLTKAIVIMQVKIREFIKNMKIFIGNYLAKIADRLRGRYYNVNDALRSLSDKEIAQYINDNGSRLELKTIGGGKLASSPIGSSQLFINSVPHVVGEWIEKISENPNVINLAMTDIKNKFLEYGIDIDTAANLKIVSYSVDTTTPSRFRENFNNIKAIADRARVIIDELNKSLTSAENNLLPKINKSMPTGINLDPIQQSLQGVRQIVNSAKSGILAFFYMVQCSCKVYESIVNKILVANKHEQIRTLA